MNDFVMKNEVEFLDNQKIEPNADDTKSAKTQFRTRNFYYERYISKVTSEHNRHFESLYLEFKAYAEDKNNRNVKDAIPDGTKIK
jgi:hypothetical protein